MVPRSRDEKRPFAAHLLRDDAIDARAEAARARELSYWRALGLAVTALPAEVAAPGLARDRLEGEELGRRVRERGFFVAPSVVEGPALTDALLAIDVVERAGWPAVFAFVSDALWRALRAPALSGTLRALLGAGARQLPGVWVHRVSVVEGARGWGPHVDVPGPARRMPDGAPSRLTAWLALTDATLDNGCLHVVPAPFAGGLAARFHEAEQADMNEVIRLLHGVRALPVDAGALIGWRLDVLHWGGVSTGQASAPRVSVSFELGHEAAPVFPDEEPSFSLDELPGFEDRLQVIGRALLAYGKAADREPFASRFVEVGEELLG